MKDVNSGFAKLFSVFQNWKFAITLFFLSIELHDVQNASFKRQGNRVRIIGLRRGEQETKISPGFTQSSRKIQLSFLYKNRRINSLRSLNRAVFYTCARQSFWVLHESFSTE